MSPLPHIHTTPTIGIFDSGMGGISVLKEINHLISHAHLIYVADSAHLPYGSKSEAFIQQRAGIITNFLIGQGADIIVVACNTATAAAIHHLRETFDKPIIGTEPAIKPAAALTKTGVIGVLATENTSKSSRLASLKDRFAHHIEVITQPCHGLVELVESFQVDTPETIALLDKYIAPLLAAKVDVIILGCTHYPFLKPAIHKLVGENVAIIDTGEAIARHTFNQLKVMNTGHSQHGEQTFYCTGDSEGYSALLGKLWQAGGTFQTISLD